jgi:putative ABC transport system permease protein
MVVLRKKMIREIKENKGVYIACMVVIAIGLLAYTSMSIVLENLERSQADFYEDTHFADGFIKLTSYPENKVNTLGSLPGIDGIEGRLIKDVRIFEEKPDTNRSLRMVSINRTTPPELNQIQLFNGRLPEDHKPEILVDPKFFAANKLKLGDSLTLILEGKRAPFTLVGTAQSPEFIYAMRSAQDLYPDPATFGIAYVPSSSLKALVKESGQVNDIAFTLKPGADFEAVKDQLQTVLKPYGLQSIIPRKDQTSHAILLGELTSLKGMTKALPAVFLGVSTIILYTMLRRLIEQQRVTIGTLKAFGLTHREIILHYLSYPLFIGGFGGLLGGLLGILLSFPLIGVYKDFFALPGLKSSFSFKYLFFGVALSLIFSLLSGIKGSLDILRLEPAEAMRPATPGSAHKTRIEQINWLWNKLSSQSQMGVRNVFRAPARSLFTVVGMAVVYSLMTVSWSMQNMTDKLTTFQFEHVQTYDVKIALNSPSSSRAVQYTLAREPGVSKIEPILEIPASLKNEWLKKEVLIMGLPPDATLYNVIDNDGKKVAVPESGILLSERLASLLQVRVGDSIFMDSPLRRDTLNKHDLILTVKGVIPQYIGLNAFMDITSLQKLLQQGEISSSMLLRINPQEIDSLKGKFRDATQVASIESMQESTDKIREMIASSSFTIYFLAVLAGIAGFALIYNSSIISLSERQRELASLRVLGMTPREVLKVITSEQWTLSLFGILLGIPLSFGLLTVMAQAVSSDLYSLPTELPHLALLGAMVGTALSVWVAQTRAHHKIRALPFVEILATKE